MKRNRVEVRVPTYKRPRLLRRALLSLCSQTHANWTCIVMDDSLEREGEKVCADINDPRITYSPNNANLGICENLNNACVQPLSSAADLCAY
jgi:glycosyltransferase involved in cell wall biosynthesis